MRFLLYLGLFLSLLGAQELSLKTPKDTVESYYYAMNHADVELLEMLMVKSSYDSTLEVWALSKALKDREFAKVLKAYGSNSKIDAEVRLAVKEKLLNSPTKVISDLEMTKLGKSRCMVRYKEDGKDKQLFTSLHEGLWKIDYKAGRRVD